MACPLECGSWYEDSQGALSGCLHIATIPPRLGVYYAQWQGPIRRPTLRCESVEQTEPRVDAEGEDVDN